MKPTGLIVAVVALLLAPVMANAIGPSERRVKPPNRPYIVEIGDPQPLGPQGLERERRLNSDLYAYLDFYGWPDHAEIQEIEPEFPWEAYEVRVYYLKDDREVAFGRAFISPEVTGLGIVKYLGRMSPGTRDRVVALTTPSRVAVEEPAPVKFQPVTEPEPEPPSDIELLVRRVEAAADRALAAADRAAGASEAARTAAERTANVLDKMTP